MSICPVDNPLADARELSLRTGAQTLSLTCITIHRYPAFSTRYSVMCKVYTRYRYHGTSETEHGFSSLWSIIHSLVLVRYLSEQAHKIYWPLVQRDKQELSSAHVRISADRIYQFMLGSQVGSRLTLAHLTFVSII